MENPLHLEIMKEIDQFYTAYPNWGKRSMSENLKKIGYDVGVDLARSFMRKMGLEAVYPKPRLTRASPEHKKYPYLLRGIKIIRPNQVWSTDITYIRMRNGFLYLTAVMDWFSRYVVSWKISNSLDGLFCREALLEALTRGKPEIFNTDQGVQFTSSAFTEILSKNGIAISMDGRGRALDNVFVERLWRTVKYENIYLHDYADGKDLYQGLGEYFDYYCNKRLHSSLSYKTPVEIFVGGQEKKIDLNKSLF